MDADPKPPPDGGTETNMTNAFFTGLVQSYRWDVGYLVTSGECSVAGAHFWSFVGHGRLLVALVLCGVRGHKLAVVDVDAENGREYVACDRCGHSITVQF